MTCHRSYAALRASARYEAAPSLRLRVMATKIMGASWESARTIDTRARLAPERLSLRAPAGVISNSRGTAFRQFALTLGWDLSPTASLRLVHQFLALTLVLRRDCLPLAVSSKLLVWRSMLARWIERAALVGRPFGVQGRNVETPRAPAVERRRGGGRWATERPAAGCRRPEALRRRRARPAAPAAPAASRRRCPARPGGSPARRESPARR